MTIIGIHSSKYIVIYIDKFTIEHQTRVILKRQIKLTKINDCIILCHIYVATNEVNIWYVLDSVWSRRIRQCMGDIWPVNRTKECGNLFEYWAFDIRHVYSIHNFLIYIFKTKLSYLNRTNCWKYHMKSPYRCISNCDVSVVENEHSSGSVGGERNLKTSYLIDWMIVKMIYTIK